MGSSSRVAHRADLQRRKWYQHQSPIQEEETSKPARTVDTLPAKSTSRRKKTSIAAIDLETADSRSRRRSARLSGDKEQLEVRPKATENRRTGAFKEKCSNRERAKKADHSSSRDPR